MIRWNALDSIQVRQERAFLRGGDLSNNYIPGEVYPNPIATYVAAMVIGERPGAQEDTQKRPFIGDAGIMLRRLLSTTMHMNVWITNTVKFYAAGNRTPDAEEIELAKPYLSQEWHAIGEPRIVICLGNVPLMAVTGFGGISRRAGRLEVYKASDGQDCFVWPMLHPSFGVRTPSMRKVIDSHWEQLGGWLDVRHKG